MLKFAFLAVAISAALGKRLREEAQASLAVVASAVPLECPDDECWCMSEAYPGEKACGSQGEDECEPDACLNPYECRPGHGYHCDKPVPHNKLECPDGECWCMSEAEPGEKACGPQGEDVCKPDACQNAINCVEHQRGNRRWKRALKGVVQPGWAYHCNKQVPHDETAEDKLECADDECWCMSEAEPGEKACGTFGKEECEPDACYNEDECPGDGYRCGHRVNETHSAWSAVPLE